MFNLVKRNVQWNEQKCSIRGKDTFLLVIYMIFLAFLFDHQDLIVLITFAGHPAATE